jgi:DNA helicase II / ATP-dependent DNA helicase PcrA
MSLHAAKGLEFDTVFCGGWEEGLFPHQRALDENGASGLEEERRLAYVGITRAKRLLYITHAANRRIYNQWQTCIPSRFLQEIPEAHVELLEGGAVRSRASGPAMFQREIEQLFAESTRVNTYSHHSSSGFPSAGEARSGGGARAGVRPPSNDSLIGKRIFHTKFGYGRVMEQSGQHLDILFEKAGSKKLMADYVTLA